MSNGKRLYAELVDTDGLGVADAAALVDGILAEEARVRRAKGARRRIVARRDEVTVDELAEVLAGLPADLAALARR